MCGVAQAAQDGMQEGQQHRQQGDGSGQVVRQHMQGEFASDGLEPTAPKAVQPLPSQLLRIEHRDEIVSGRCPQGHALRRLGEEIREQLDCEPTRFFVHRHIRGKYACACCQTVLAAPMPAQITDKGIPAAGLLAQVVLATHDDHLPLYRQEEIDRRSGAHIPRSSMAQWVGICGVRLEPLAAAMKAHVLSQPVLHADETPVAELAPGTGKTHRADVWVYRSAGTPAVVFDSRTC